MEACIPALRRYAGALLHNRQDADDLVHDCLVRALERLHTRPEDHDIRVWLFAIIHDLFVSQLRKGKVRSLMGSLGGHEPELAVQASQVDQLIWQDLVRGLSSLPVGQRTVVLLISVEGLSYAEAANVLKIPPGTVMSRLARGRERLRHLTGHKARPILQRAL